MRIPLYQIDAFTDKPFRGNPAAVCPLPEWPGDGLLQAIAAENNLSETAFFVMEDGGYHVRWFTPDGEVDLCGHATLATAYVLFSGECRERKEIQFNSKSGALRVLREDPFLTLDFPAALAVPGEEPADLTEGLGATPVAYYRSMDHMAVFEDEREVAELSPDFRRLKNLDLRGVIVTAPGGSEDFVSRFFAPKFGIDEDPVTGSAHCTLVPYWAGRLGKHCLKARQVSRRTGDLVCRMEKDRVFISGRAVPFMKGHIELNSL